MQPFKTKLLLSFCLIFILASCSFGGNTGLNNQLASETSSSSYDEDTSMPGNDGQDNKGTANPEFEAIAPVDIPIPIAKVTIPIDPTTLIFTENQTTLENKTQIGSLSGQLVQKTNCVEQTIGLEHQNQLIAKDQTKHCTFEFSIPEKLVNESFELKILEDVSKQQPIVAVKVGEDDLIENYTLTVQITDDHVGPHKTVIQNQQLAFHPEGSVNYIANDHNKPRIGSIDVLGGIQKPLLRTTASFRNLQYGHGDHNKILYGVNNQTNQVCLFFENDKGAPTTQCEAAHLASTTKRSLALDPTGRLMAVKRQTHGKLKIEITKAINPNAVKASFAVLDNEARVVDTQFSWYQQNALIAFNQLENGETKAVIYKVGDLLNAPGQQPEATALFTSEVKIANPLADWGVKGDFYYECETQQGTMGLCQWQASHPNETTLLIEGDFNVQNVHLSKDRQTYLILETDSQEGSDDDNYVAIYYNETDKLQYINRGLKPISSPTRSDIVSYLSLDTNNHYQVSVMNLTNLNLLTTELKLTPKQTAVQKLKTQTFTALGGEPPYSYSVLAGGGSIDESMGIYQAPNQEGLATIEVTDSQGQTAQASTTIYSSGGLDYSFGNQGKALTAMGSFSQINATAVQVDGKIVSTGYFKSSNGNRDIFVMRHLQDGSLDESFGTGGLLVLSQSLNSHEEARALTISSDDKILIAGFSTEGSNSDFYIVKMDLNGGMDPSFGNNGVALIDVGTATDQAYDLVIDKTDGSIFVTGQAYNNMIAENQFATIKLDAFGKLDPSFGNAGIRLDSLVSDNSYATAIALQKDGRLLVGGPALAGPGNADFMVIAYDKDGKLDAAGFNGGYRQINFEGSSNDILTDMIVDDQDSIYLAGHSDNQFALAKLKPDGNLDNTFGSNAKTVTALSSAGSEAMAIQFDKQNRIVLAGHAIVDFKTYHALARYQLDGSLADSFIDNQSSVTEYAHSLTVQNNGRYILAGQSGTQVSLTRIWP